MFDCPFQKLPLNRESSHDNFDSFLLHFTSAFTFVHFGFAFYAGVVHVMSWDDGSAPFFPGWLVILDSALNIVEIPLLLMFFLEMMGKVRKFYSSLFAYVQT